MTTVARPSSSNGSHFYWPDGRPCYEVENKSKGGMRPTTVGDAKKLGLLPSVTQILKILHKQALVDWLIEQACLALMTTPRLPNEPDDAFVQRVLHTERVQDQESQKARDRGTEIHAALEDLFCGKPISSEIEPWVRPAFEAVCKYGELGGTEKVLVGDGYAGKCDLIQLFDKPPIKHWWIWDWKSAKKLPDPAKGGAWSDHKLQAAGYAAAFQKQSNLAIHTGNIYISTMEQGKFVICEHESWFKAYDAFAALVKVWQWQNGYTC